MTWKGSYQPGRPYAVCDRCYAKVRLDELRTEWSNSRVCDGCYDPRPVHLSTPVLRPGEGAPLPGARPDTQPEAADADLDFGYRDEVSRIYPQYPDGEVILIDEDGEILLDEDDTILTDEP